MTWANVGMFVAVAGVVIAAQYLGCTSFDQDEISRIIWTLLGVLGVQGAPAIASKLRG